MGSDFQNDIFVRLKEEARQNQGHQRESMERKIERLRREREIRENENQRRIREMRQNRERERGRERNNIFLPNFFNNQRENGVNNNGNLDVQFFGNILNQIINISSNVNDRNHNNNNRNNNERNNNERNNSQRNNNNNIVDILEEIYISQDIIDKAEIKDCPICLEEYSIENKICYLPCFHFFHSECIKTWLKNSNKCPLCKVDIKFDE